METAARIEPGAAGKLMTIILDDVQRVDRLISDISDASRLDAELSRADFAPVDLAAMAATVRDVMASPAWTMTGGWFARRRRQLGARG